ncbi:MAG: hypothetical protein U0M31_04940 [Oscillospiraceae bacterium]|nr:hypothetical protein [Oscillospiraceae bacterium]
MKKLFALLLSVFIALSISVSAFAVTQRATNRVNITAMPNKTATIGTSLSMEADETVTINCTYSPRTADVDFGLITPRGTFVFVEGEDGNCNQTIQVSQTGDYYFAVRNNSSNDVEVLGYVYY